MPLPIERVHQVKLWTSVLKSVQHVDVVAEEAVVFGPGCRRDNGQDEAAAKFGAPQRLDQFPGRTDIESIDNWIVIMGADRIDRNRHPG